MRVVSVVMVLAALAMSSLVTPSPVKAADCQFVLGFKALHDMIPDVVGDCKTNEYHNPANGDGLQETTRGLMVWRKSDNFTAFTDGFRSWVNGPRGLQQRLNTERFSWEKDPVNRPATGTYVRDGQRDGAGRLLVKNGWSDDVVVVLATPANAPVLAVYIRADEEFVVTGIRDGTYRVFYMRGEGWDAGAARFQAKAFTARSSLTPKFETKAGAGTDWTITLTQGTGSGTSVAPVDPGEFPALR